MCINEIGLARGYLKRPELNQQAFIPNPFVSKAQAEQGYDRIYKTGDLVRYLQSGDVQYVARKDRQVKIRGYRIELGEIKTRLASIVGNGKALVIDRKRNGQPYLAAYVVTQSPLDEQASGNIGSTLT